MNNQVQEFRNGSLTLPVKEVNGDIYIDAEKASIGFGLYEIKNGKQYVIWKRVSKYLSTKVSKGDFITESQFYKLAIKANNSVAEKFQDWVTSEVLPTIRKHGAYMTDEKLEEALLNPDTLIKLATELKKERNGRLLAEQQVNEMRPKALFADAVSTSETPILVGELAKMLKQNGIEMGQRRLFTWMREKGYLIKRKGTDYNMPTQRAMELGLFRIKESTHVNGDGVVVISKTPKVTGKGQVYFVNKFMEG